MAKIFITTTSSAYTGGGCSISVHTHSFYVKTLELAQKEALRINEMNNNRGPSYNQTAIAVDDGADDYDVPPEVRAARRLRRRDA